MVLSGPNGVHNQFHPLSDETSEPAAEKSTRVEFDGFTNTIFARNGSSDEWDYEGNCIQPHNKGKGFTNTVFAENGLSDEWDYEGNCIQPHNKGKGFTNTVFAENGLSDEWDYEGNFSQPHNRGKNFINVIFSDNDSDDEWDNFDWLQPQTFHNAIFSEEDLSDEFQRNWTPPVGFTNVSFPESDDSDDFGPNYPTSSTIVTAEQVRRADYRPPQRYTAHSNPPQSSAPKPATNGDRLQEGFLQSLLAEPQNAVTKEDLAMFAKLIHDQHAQAQRAQLSQAQQIWDLQGQGDQQAPVIPGPIGRKSNEKVPRDPEVNELKELVRQAAFRAMGRVKSQNGGPDPIISATPQEVRRFLTNPPNPRLGPQKDNLVLDFNDGVGARSVWNKKATEIFAEMFVQTNNQYSFEEVSAAFKTHLFHLKKKYIAYTKFVTNRDTMGEQADILTPCEDSKYNSRKSRRRQLLGRRVGACTRYSQEYPEIDRLHNLWKTMPVEAMSGDETDHHNGQLRYVITTLPWRAAWVRQWMLVFDRLHLSKRFNSGRATPGAFPHIRISADRPLIDREFTTVPVGLPRNFYCPEWLAQQTPRFIENLQMQEPIDTKFPNKIIRIAWTCSNVTSHLTPPMPLDRVPENITHNMMGSNTPSEFDFSTEEMDVS